MSVVLALVPGGDQISEQMEVSAKMIESVYAEFGETYMKELQKAVASKPLQDLVRKQVAKQYKGKGKGAAGGNNSSSNSSSSSSSAKANGKAKEEVAGPATDALVATSDADATVSVDVLSTSRIFRAGDWRTIYEFEAVDMRPGGSSISHVWRRYSSAYVFHEDIEEEVSVEEDFPPKKLFGSLAEDVVAARKTSFKRYMSALSDQAKARGSSVFREFLGLRKPKLSAEDQLMRKVFNAASKKMCLKHNLPHDEHPESEEEALTDLLFNYVSRETLPKLQRIVRNEVPDALGLHTKCEDIFKQALAVECATSVQMAWPATARAAAKMHTKLQEELNKAKKAKGGEGEGEEDDEELAEESDEEDKGKGKAGSSSSSSSSSSRGGGGGGLNGVVITLNTKVAQSTQDVREGVSSKLHSVSVPLVDALQGLHAAVAEELAALKQELFDEFVQKDLVRKDYDTIRTRIRGLSKSVASVAEPLHKANTKLHSEHDLKSLDALDAILQAYVSILNEHLDVLATFAMHAFQAKTNLENGVKDNKDHRPLVSSDLRTSNKAVGKMVAGEKKNSLAIMARATGAMPAPVRKECNDAINKWAITQLNALEVFRVHLCGDSVQVNSKEAVRAGFVRVSTLTWEYLAGTMGTYFWKHLKTVVRHLVTHEVHEAAEESLQEVHKELAENLPQALDYLDLEQLSLTVLDEHAAHMVDQTMEDGKEMVLSSFVQ